MKKMSRKKSRQTMKLAYLAAISATLYTPFFANATSVTSQCNYTGSSFAYGGETMPGCPAGIAGSGTLTTTNGLRGGPGYYAGVRISGNPGVPQPIYIVKSTGAISCRWPTYSGSTPFFVPTGSVLNYELEWQKFLDNASSQISGLSLESCAIPYSVAGTASTQSFALPAVQQSAGCNVGTSVSFNTPPVFGKTGYSVYPSAPDTLAYNCYGGTTTMVSTNQWTAGNVETTGVGTTGWTADTKFSPNVHLYPSSTTAYQPGYSGDGLPATVTLYWDITASNGNPLNCYTSGWPGPDASGNPRSGSVAVNMYGSSSYNLTCYENGTLVSTASTYVAFVGAPPPPPPPPPPCCYGDGGGYYGDGGG